MSKRASAEIWEADFLGMLVGFRACVNLFSILSKKKTVAFLLEHGDGRAQRGDEDAGTGDEHGHQPRIARIELFA